MVMILYQTVVKGFDGVESQFLEYCFRLSPGAQTALDCKSLSRSKIAN